jgi:hypothetical protein
MFKTNWHNNFDIYNEKCRVKNVEHVGDQELKLIRKANMMVLIIIIMTI